MSCLNLNKFLPARKAWGVFAHKVQTKLHKLHPSKTIKKPPKRKIVPRNTSKRSSCWPAFSIQRKRFKLKPKQTPPRHYYYIQKAPSAVYIDQLFIEAAVPTVKEYLQPSLLRAAAASNHVYEEETRPSTSSAKEPKFAVSQELIGGTNKGKGKQLTEAMHSADDMWESFVLASPQTYGINERAEEFINKFRAEMMLQERLARHL